MGFISLTSNAHPNKLLSNDVLYNIKKYINPKLILLIAKFYPAKTCFFVKNFSIIKLIFLSKLAMNTSYEEASLIF